MPGAWELARKILKLKKEDKTAFYSPSPIKEFVADSGVSMHMVSKKDLNETELGTVRMSKNPTMVLSANKRRGNGIRPRIGLFRDSNASRRYTGSSFTWKTQRRIWVQLSLDEWPETTSHQERHENSL